MPLEWSSCRLINAHFKIKASEKATLKLRYCLYAICTWHLYPCFLGVCIVFSQTILTVVTKSTTMDKEKGK